MLTVLDGLKWLAVIAAEHPPENGPALRTKNLFLVGDLMSPRKGSLGSPIVGFHQIISERVVGIDSKLLLSFSKLFK